MEQPPDLAAGLTRELTTLGKIGAPHGLKGWVRLISFTDPADNILKFRHFTLAAQGIPGSRAVPGMLEQIEIDESRPQGKIFIGHIRGCDDPDQARVYTGRELQVEKNVLPELGEEEYYWFQLEGLRVMNQQDENLGVVHHLIETGANDVLIVRATRDSIDEQERLIPYVREQVVKQIDLDERILRVDWEKDY